MIRKSCLSYELSKSLVSFGHIIMACLKLWLATSPMDMYLMTHFWAPHYASIERERDDNGAEQDWIIGVSN